MVKYFYNIILKDDVCDFYSDILTQIRIGYHTTKLKQKGKLTQYSADSPICYEYGLEKDKSIKWRVSNAQGVLSNTKKLQDGKYCVSYYNNNILTKTLTFSKYHTLLKVEYYKLDATTNASSKLTCTIEPRKSGKNLCLLIKDEEKASILYAAPSVEDEFVLSKLNTEFNEYTAVACTDAGVVKFLSKEQMASYEQFVSKAQAERDALNEPCSFIKDDETVLAQRLNPKDFNVKRNLSQTIDLTCACEFSFASIDAVEDTQVKDSKLTEDDAIDLDNIPQFDIDTSDEVDNNEVKKCEEDSLASTNGSFVNSPDKPAFEHTKEVCADSVIVSANRKYYYYGELDSNGKRSGYGRTATANGKTAYEGEYANNKRNGVGSYYYKDGTLCYYGDWKDNKRQGFGVGISSFDKSVHIGEFSNDKPVGDGVRFDSDGKISFVNKVLSNGSVATITFDGDKIIIIESNDKGKIVSKDLSDL